MKILFCGDVCFKYHSELTYDSAKDMLADVKPIFDSVDYRVMNLENPLAPEGVGEPIYKSGPNIIGRPENIGFLEAAGCELAVLANNHTGDYGDPALIYTLELLNKHNIDCVGAGHNIDEAYSAHRIEKDGVKISFLGINENEFGIADEDTPGTAGFELGRLAEKIAEEKAVSDYVIVVFHGGNEHNPLPSPGCRSRYRTLIRLGADALIGGHTHCIQGYEYYLGKPIVYSTGNFLFRYDTEKNDIWYNGYIVELTIENGGLSIRPIPYHYDNEKSVFIAYKGEELEKMLGYIDRLSSYIGNDAELKRLYKGWCTKAGVDYLRAMNAKPEYFLDENLPAKMAGLRNLLVCEAHNELCKTTLELAFTGELKEARKWYDELMEIGKLPK